MSVYIKDQVPFERGMIGQEKSLFYRAYIVDTVEEMNSIDKDELVDGSACLIASGGGVLYVLNGSTWSENSNLLNYYGYNQLG